MGSTQETNILKESLGYKAIHTPFKHPCNYIFDFESRLIINQKATIKVITIA